MALQRLHTPSGDYHKQVQSSVIELDVLPSGGPYVLVIHPSIHPSYRESQIEVLSPYDTKASYIGYKNVL